jgi:hypothetical protein
MITYSNIQRYDNVDFSDYLEHQGLSTSFLKRELNGVNPYLEITDNIRTGSLVDAILTDNGKVNMNDKLFDSAIKISKAITNQFGTMIKAFETQISYTCDMEYNGFVMQSKGRLDYLLPNIAVVDLKVTQGKDTKALIEFMGYKNQLWHYAKMAKVNKAYIMIHSVPLNKTEIHEVDVSIDFNPFWASKVEKFGKLKTV